VRRGLAIVNLAASLAVAAFGFYAWHFTVTRHVDVPVKRWTTYNGGGGADLVFRHTTHTHATLAYAAWAVAVSAAVLTIWQRRRTGGAAVAALERQAPT
jgi:hypothetical protein